MQIQTSLKKIKGNWIFLVPCLLCLLISVGWPMIRTLYFSFTDASLDDFSRSSFIGLTNFITLCQDDEWWEAVLNTVIFAGSSVFLETVFGMMIALAMHQRFKGRGFMRVAVLIPWVIPTIVSAKIWAWMLNDVYGVINAMLLKIGLLSSPLPWIASNELSMISIILVDVWKTTPYMALLLLAGLQSLPQECFDVADVDGVPPIKKFIYITLPLMYKTLVIAVLFRSLDAMRVFDLVYALSSGNSSTATMSVFARKNLVDFSDVGYGSAAATVLLFMVAFLGILYISWKSQSATKEVAA